MRNIITHSFILLFLFISFHTEGIEPPNILLIVADDLGYNDLSCQGAEDIFTPAIDRIAKSGIRFTSGYVTAPQCGPSRAGIITGVSQNRFSYLDNSNHSGIPKQNVLPTMSEQFTDLGYKTGIIGKWHVGHVVDDLGRYNLAGNNPWERGFQYVLIHEGGGSHYFPYSTGGENWMTSRGREYRLTEKMENSNEVQLLNDLPAETYLTDYFSERAVDFVERNADDPWFLFLSYNAPHSPLVAKDEDMNANSHIEDLNRRKFAAMMTSMDRGVDSLVKKLAELGELSNTMIWFISDNGGPTAVNTSLNTPFSGYKGHMYEGGIRVPFMVSWPGTFPEDTVMDHIITSIDILPTSLAAAGKTDLPEVYEGYNLLDYFKNGGEYPRNEMFVQWRSGRSAVRLDQYKELRNGIKLKLLDGTEYPSEGFYDLNENPAESPDLMLEDVLKRNELTAALDQWLYDVSLSQLVLTPDIINIPERQMRSDFSIFPTLFTSRLTIKPHAHGKNYSIRIFNVTGSVIKEMENLRGNVNIDMSDSTSGIYFISFNSENRQSTKKAICVNN